MNLFEQRQPQVDYSLVEVTAYRFSKGAVTDFGEELCFLDVDYYEITEEVPDEPPASALDNGYERPKARFLEEAIGFDFIIIGDGIGESDSLVYDVENMGTCECFQPFKVDLLRKARESIEKIPACARDTDNVVAVRFIGLFSYSVRPAQFSDDECETEIKLIKFVTARDFVLLARESPE